MTYPPSQIPHMYCSKQLSYLTCMTWATPALAGNRYFVDTKDFEEYSYTTDNQSSDLGALAMYLSPFFHDLWPHSHNVVSLHDQMTPCPMKNMRTSWSIFPTCTSLVLVGLTKIFTRRSDYSIESSPSADHEGILPTALVDSTNSSASCRYWRLEEMTTSQKIQLQISV